MNDSHVSQSECYERMDGMEKEFNGNLGTVHSRINGLMYLVIATLAAGLLNLAIAIIR